MTLTPAEVQTILKVEKEEALGINTAPLSEERNRALAYYQGDMAKDMPSLDGRSSAVSSDVSDTIEGLMPALMEIFASGEEVVRFEPVGEEDEQAAQQETDYVNHVFLQKNPGFLVLYSMIKDALLSKVGMVKIYWSEDELEERETYENQPDDAYMGLVNRPDVEVLEHTEHPDESDPNATVHDVTLTTKRSYGCARADPVPPEEFGISKRARNIKDATYIYHQPAAMTEADLIAQGYDEDQVKKLPGLHEAKAPESSRRDPGRAETSSTDAVNKSMRPIDVVEHYIRMDYNKDSRPGLYRVTTAGDKHEILLRDNKPDIIPVDMMPFAAATPVIMTHRFFGRSIADLVMDIQRIKTALLRSLLDNAYLLNNQRLELAESHAHERTLDDLLVNRPGGVVRTKMPGGLIPIPNQPIGNALFPLIEYMDATREWRTGVTKQGQGINADALQNQSATAVNQLFSAAQARVKMIARIIAETGVRDMFGLLHATIRKNDTKQNVVRLRNKWVTVDPRAWKTRDDMTINVGLGSGSREQQVQHLLMVLGLQKEAIAMPALNLVKPKNLYNTAEKLVERIGLKSVTPYFSDPEQPEIDPQTGQPKQPEPPPPDPKMIEVQGKLELEKQKAGADMQVKQGQVQAGMQSDQAKMQMEFALRREQMQMEFQMKQQQMAAEIELKREEMMLTMRLKSEHGYYKPNGGGIEPVRMGGEVG